jgi:hypothetical protein
MPDMHKVNLFIEPELWRLVRIRAAETNSTATKVLNDVLRRYFEVPAERADKRSRKGARP